MICTLVMTGDIIHLNSAWDDNNCQTQSSSNRMKEFASNVVASSFKSFALHLNRSCPLSPLRSSSYELSSALYFCGVVYIIWWVNWLSPPKQSYMLHHVLLNEAQQLKYRWRAIQIYVVHMFRALKSMMLMWLTVGNLTCTKFTWSNL